MLVNDYARFAVAAAAFATLGATGASGSPAMFHGDAAHLGVYDSAAPSLKSVAWRFHTKGKIFSSPTIGSGVAYVGSTDGRLYAVRANDGTKLWAFATRGAVNSTPAVANGTVFFSSLDGNVYAVDAARGTQKWRFRTGGERRFTAPGIHGIAPSTELMPDPFDVFLSSPAVAGGTVYIGSGDHNVYALDAQSGALRWKFATGNVVHASPAVHRGLVFIGSWDRFFYALDARSGAVVWKFATGDDRTTYNQVGIAGSAAVADGTVYFGCRDSHFYALDEKTGALRWKRDEHGSWVIATPAVGGDTVYYTTSDERKFFAVDAATGAVRFSVGLRRVRVLLTLDRRRRRLLRNVRRAALRRGRAFGRRRRSILHRCVGAQPRQASRRERQPETGGFLRRTDARRHHPRTQRRLRPRIHRRFAGDRRRDSLHRQHGRHALRRPLNYCGRSTSVRAALRRTAPSLNGNGCSSPRTQSLVRSV